MSELKKAQSTQEAEFSVKKLSPFFVDEVANISISPNGACRLQFATWQTNEEGKPLRVDSEIILTIQSLKMLSDSLPKAIEQAEKMMAQSPKQPDIQGSLQ